MKGMLMERLFDVLIIGGGAVGCAIARELSRNELKIAVLEKEADVASGTSGRNSAVVHAGFNNKPGTLMAKLCVEGNEGFEALCAELDVPYKKTGKLLVAFNEEQMQTLERLLKQGDTNGCKGLRLVDKDTVQKMAPNVGGIGGFSSPNTAIFDPFIYTIALAENAVANGVDVEFMHFGLGSRAEPAFKPADTVVANILGPLLIRFADEIVPYAKKDLVISGILTELYPEVLSVYESRGFKEVSRKTIGEWTTGLLCACK